MSQDSVWQGKDGQWYLRRCPECNRENYALAVASGQCCWCGYKAGESDNERREKQDASE